MNFLLNPLTSLSECRLTGGSRGREFYVFDVPVQRSQTGSCSLDLSGQVGSAVWLSVCACSSGESVSGCRFSTRRLSSVFPLGIIIIPEPLKFVYNSALLAHAACQTRHKWIYWSVCLCLSFSVVHTVCCSPWSFNCPAEQSVMNSALRLVLV